MKIQKMKWQELDVSEVFLKLKTDEKGLSSSDFEKRVAKYGKNELPKKQRFTYLGVILDQFKSPLVYILLIASLVSIVLDEVVDAVVILFAVFLNTVVGFFQEVKAEKTLEALSNLVTHKAYVIRDGIEKEVDASQITVGDVIILKSGDRIPADCRIISSYELEVDESILTGESLPVKKVSKKVNNGSDQTEKNLVYMGSSVVRGRGSAVVFAIGSSTKFGEIADILTLTADDPTPLQKQLDNFSKFFGKVTFFILFFVTFIGLLRGLDFFDIFLTSVAIAVAAIPEGVLVAVTIILAIGMQRISKKGSLVRKLIAAETLGSVSIICTDKTGTLTQGKMQLNKIVSLGGSVEVDNKCKKSVLSEEEKYSEHVLSLYIGMVCNDAVIENPQDEFDKWVIHGGYTEKAFLFSGLCAGIDFSEINSKSPRVDEIPFSSKRKFMATLNKEEGGHVMYAKGAAEEIMIRSKYVYRNGKSSLMNEDDIRFLRKKQNEMSREGLRVLAVAFKKVDKKEISSFKESKEEEVVKDLVFVGLVALKDPLREETKKTIELAKRAGITTIMITGDNALTAMSIANELGMKVGKENILEGEDLNQMSNGEFYKVVNRIKVYARVSPEHKTRIVDAWQSKGQVVAMTGDGVNDAPALKKADIGVALGSGTEVAKETADMVLLDDNFSTIIKAVEQGRVIFDNIRKVILYLISDSFSEVIVVAGGLLLGVPIPFTAAQILWINLITDGLPDIALTLEPEEEGIMQQKPRKKKEPLINTEIKTLVVVISSVTGLIALALFYFIYHSSGDFVKASSITFSILAVDSLVYVFSTRSLRYSIFQKNIFSNKYLILAVFIGFTFQLLAIYHPFMQNVLGTTGLSLSDWGIVFATSVITLFMIESIKHVFIVKKAV